MVSRQLVDYIRQNLQKGHSLEEIRRFLSSYGWSDKDIDEGILEVSGTRSSQPVPGTAAPEVKQKKGHKKLIIAVIILIILIIVFLYTAADIVRYFQDMFPNTVLPFNMTILG